MRQNKNQQSEKTAAEAVAAEVMTVSDWRTIEAEGLSAEEYLEREHGVDPNDHNDAEELHAAVLSSWKKNGDPSNTTGDASDETTLSASTGSNSREYGDSEVASLAESVMSVSEWRDAEQADQSPTEYVHSKYGVDPREHRTEAGLRQAIDQRAEQ